MTISDLIKTPCRVSCGMTAGHCVINKSNRVVARCQSEKEAEAICTAINEHDGLVEMCGEAATILDEKRAAIAEQNEALGGLIYGKHEDSFAGRAALGKQLDQAVAVHDKYKQEVRDGVD